jgi:hypothetical protein
MEKTLVKFFHSGDPDLMYNTFCEPMYMYMLCYSGKMQLKANPGDPTFVLSLLGKYLYGRHGAAM